jgi:hypothetical protein
MVITIFVGGILQIINANYNLGSKSSVNFASGFWNFVSHHQKKFRHIKTLIDVEKKNELCYYLIDVDCKCAWVGGGHNHIDSILLPNWQNTFSTF